MALSRDIVIRLLGDASSAIAAQKAAADAAEVPIAAYRKAEREYDKQQAAEKAALSARKQSMQEASQSAMILGGAMLAAFGIAAKAAMDFDKSMSAVGAATMANAEQMGALREAALDAGAATMYSAKEAADAETELAKAGISVKDILGGGLKGALDLAAAGQLAVADAAGIAATAMQQFHLSGSQTSHVADLLAAGAGKAMGSVQDLAGALKYVGPVAAGMGISIEQTTGALAMFASQGILGEQAGTSLRGVISALSSPSKVAQNAMDDLGISVFDAQGKFIGLDGVAGQLHGAMSGLTEAERSAALGRIFGNEQLTAARVLYQQGAAGVQEWTDKVNDSGYAQEQAARLTDNLAGDLERLGGSISTVLIEGGSKATGVLRFLVQAATGTVDTIGTLPGPLQAVGAGFLGIVGGGTLLLGALGTIIPKIQEARAALEALGPAGAKANSALGALGKAGAAAAAATVGISLMANAYDALHPPAEVAVADSTELTHKLEELGASTGSLSKVMRETGLTR
jgi:TP901 family phage tail tape measure protein